MSTKFGELSDGHISGATFANTVGVCWGNCTKLSYLMCPLTGIKCPHLILGVLLPKNVLAEKRSFEQRHFVTLLLEQYTVDSKTALHHSRTCLPNLLNFGPETAKCDRFSTHSKSTFTDAHISGQRCVAP